LPFCRLDYLASLCFFFVIPFRLSNTQESFSDHNEKCVSHFFFTNKKYLNSKMVSFHVLLKFLFHLNVCFATHFSFFLVYTELHIGLYPQCAPRAPPSCGPSEKCLCPEFRRAFSLKKLVAAIFASHFLCDRLHPVSGPVEATKCTLRLAQATVNNGIS
jgi:hypothetical protein